MRVTYFAHDLSDPAVARRVRMLRLGGATLTLLGFRRSSKPVEHVDGIEAFDLGQTFEGKLLTRAALVAKRSMAGRTIGPMVADADVLLARNLEMATLAEASRLWTRSDVQLAYECLDIHPAQLGLGVVSRMLRGWDRHILRRSSALLVSSTAFVSHYFAGLGVRLPKIILVENKQIHNDMPQRSEHSAVTAPPWRIGWFGNLRCERSFHALLQCARTLPTQLDVQLRGVPSQAVQRLIDEHLPIKNMSFGGPYARTDLSTLYGACHFTWAVDEFQPRTNSAWLLPNRIYEGSYYAKPTIALAGTEIARWVERHGSGFLLYNPETEVHCLLSGLSDADYRLSCARAAEIPLRDLVYEIEDCRKLVADLSTACDVSADRLAASPVQGA
jgi:succinoglycan biosynthesis protein ExoL